MRFLFVLLLAGCSTLPTQPPPGEGRPFRFPEDTFAFANETVFNYRDGQPVTDDREDGERYTRRCFVMAAAAVQFWKHARFDPDAPPVSEKELARRVRQVTRRAAWDPIPEQKIVFPGFANLHEMDGRILRANLGAGWTTYFHTRKYVMQARPTKNEHAYFNELLQRWLARGHPMVLWLYNFPNVNINHAVVAYAITDGGYLIYDPNFTDRPRELRYDPATQTFSYETTFYFPGGNVLVRPVYLNVWH
jgi:hypothetical protein